MFSNLIRLPLANSMPQNTTKVSCEPIHAPAGVYSVPFEDGHVMEKGSALVHALVLVSRRVVEAVLTLGMVLSSVVTVKSSSPERLVTRPEVTWFLGEEDGILETFVNVGTEVRLADTV